MIKVNFAYLGHDFLGQDQLLAAQDPHTVVILRPQTTPVCSYHLLLSIHGLLGRWVPGQTS